MSKCFANYTADDVGSIDEPFRYSKGRGLASYGVVGGQVELPMWQGMVHVFPTNLSSLQAA